MRKYFDRWTLAGAAIAIIAFLAFTPRHTLAGIIQAIIPAAVPTANKQGNSSKFALASGTFTPGNCTETDGSGNLVDGGVVCNGVGGGTPGAFVFSSTTNAGPSNTGTETSLVGTVVGSTSIAANTFTNGAVLEAMSQGFFSLPAVADSITLKMKCGSTVIGSAATTLPAGILSNGSFRFWLRVTARGSGAGGAFMTNGFAEFSGSALTASEVKVLNTSTVAFDFTTSCAFDITAQWGGAQSGESITGTNAGVWFPGAPVTSVGGLTGAVPGEGNGSKVQLFTGSDPATNDCAKFDANHNIVGAGAACASGSGSFNLIEQHTASTSSELDFTTCISSTYDTYQVQLLNVIPTTNAVKIGMQVHTVSGYDTTSGHYFWSAYALFSTGQGANGSASDSAMYLTNEQSNTASDGGLNGQFYFYNPASTAGNKLLIGSTMGKAPSNGNAGLGWFLSSAYNQTTAVDGFRIIPSGGGTIASGTVRCYGISK